MDFSSIKKIYQQALQGWQNLPAYQKSVFASGIILLAAVFSIFFYYQHETYAVLIPDESLKTVDLQEAKRYLDSNKIPYKTRGQSTILVPSSQLEHLRVDLLTHGMAKSQPGKGFELFDTNTWIKGEKELQILELRALKGQLERDLTQFENIRSASVILDIAPPRPFGGSSYKTKASVILNLMPGARLPNSELRAITFHISGAVRGLTPNMIAISDTTGKLYQAIDPDGDADTIRNAEISLEEHLKAKIDGMLTTIVGYNNFFSTVQVTMTRDRVTEERETFSNASAKIKRVDGQSSKDTSSPTDLVKTISGPGKVDSISITVLIDNQALKNRQTYYGPSVESGSASNAEDLRKEIQHQLKTVLQGYNAKIYDAISFVNFDPHRLGIQAIAPLTVNTVIPNKNPYLEYFIILAALIAFLALLSFLKALFIKKETYRTQQNNKMPTIHNLRTHADPDLEKMIHTIQARLKNHPEKVITSFQEWLK